MSTLLQDLRYAVRVMGRSPGFTLVAVLTLALGIGANATIFTWVNGFLLNGFPGIPDQDRMVIFSTVYRGNNMSVSYPDFVDFWDRNTLLEGIVATDMQAMNLVLNGQAERIYGKLVSGDYFTAIGVRPVIGRGFLPEEGKTPGAHPVVVISHALWHRKFGGDPRVIGREIILNNASFTVVGVTPPEFRGTYIGLAFDAYVPLMMVERFISGSNRLTARGNHWLDALAKLKPGVTLEQAQAELIVISRQLSQAYPDTNQDVVGTLYPLWKAPYGATSIMGPVLLILSAVVALVLLIACANVANLLLARAASRRREIAIRLSLGAGRGRLVRQLLTESVLLAIMGGAAGLGFAYWSWDLLLAFMPSLDLPIALQEGLNSRVLWFTFVLSALTGMVFGLAPAMEASRRDVVFTLKDETGSLAAGGRRGHLRGSLVIAQVSLSLLLLISAGLLIRSLRQAHTVGIGFNPKGLLLASMNLFPNGYTEESGRSFQRQLLERLRALQGVEAVSLARRIPLGFGGSSSTSIEPEGYQPAKDERPFANYNHVSPDYFRSMGIPLDRGRDFSQQDIRAGQKVMIVNEALAERYWPGKDPIGRRIRVSGDSVTIVGLVRTTKYMRLDEAPRPFFYFLLEQYYRPDVTLHVLATGNPTALTAAVREIVRAQDPNLPLFNITTLERHISAASFTQRLGGSFLGGLGSLALVLTSIGMYGVMSFSVSQRTREIGIRMALGARQSDILRTFLGQGTRLTAIGVLLGLAGALPTTQFLERMLFGVSATDPLTFIGVVLLLGIVATLATYIPARRATQVDPMIALRYE